MFQNWLEKRRIVHEINKAYSLELNGQVERPNHTLMDI